MVELIVRVGIVAIVVVPPLGLICLHVAMSIARVVEQNIESIPPDNVPYRRLRFTKTTSGKLGDLSIVSLETRLWSQ